MPTLREGAEGEELIHKWIGKIDIEEWRRRRRRLEQRWATWQMKQPNQLPIELKTRRKIFEMERSHK